MSWSKLLADGPLVTVYVPCRNYGRYLAQAIESVRSQLYPNWELFIIDEASTDNTRATAEHFRSLEPKKIHLIENQEPLGLQRIANQIIDRAHGKYIVRLDADDWLEESALLLMVAKLESDSTLGIVYGNYFYTSGAGEVIGMERRHKLGVEDVAGHMPPHGACTMVRLRVLKAVGGYSEDVNAQDGWELWYKLVNRVKAASIEAPIFYYRQHEQSLSRDSARLLNARAKILEQARERLEGGYMPSCLAVIPVRESYPDFDGVPYQKIGKRTLLEYALDAAAAESISEVVVSTESSQVLEFAAELTANGLARAHIGLKRPAELSGSHIRLRAILLHAGEAFHAARGAYPDMVVFLNLHAPLRRALHVNKAIDTMRITACDSVVSVCEEREPIFAHGREGLDLLNPGRFEELNFERERLYRFNGAVLATWWEVLAGGDLFGQSIGHIEMSEAESLQVKRPGDLKNPRLRRSLVPSG